MPTTSDRLSNHTALTVLSVLAAILANAVLMMQLFVVRPEYTAELKDVQRRLHNIELKLGIASPAQAESNTGDPKGR